MKIVLLISMKVTLLHDICARTVSYYVIIRLHMKTYNFSKRDKNSLYSCR